jgi:starvation-inducible DNA-binding protein
MAKSNNNLTMTKEKESVNIGMDNDFIQSAVDILTRDLADIEVVYVKTLNMHWNIVGPNFYSVHLLLDEQYHALAKLADEVAERIRSYNRPAIGSLNEFLAHTSLNEKRGDSVVMTDALDQLVADHEAIMRQLRNDIKRCTEELHDQGAADLLIKQLQIHQQMAWMLRSHLQ